MSVVVEFCPTQLGRHTKKAAGALLLFAACVMVAHCGAGCQEAASSLNDPAHNYATEIIACAATAGYPGAYDSNADMRCRNGVNCKYELPSCIVVVDAGR